MIRRKGKGGLRLVLAGIAALVWGWGSAFSQPRTVHVPAQPLAQSLKDVAHQTGTNILFAPDAVQGLHAAAVEGMMTAEAAVERLIAGTNLQVVLDSDGGLIVRPRVAAAPPPAAPQGIVPHAAPFPDPEMETIIVTGIRGSLQRGLDIKRQSVGLVDAITMEEVGRFPDSNLATAMMRIPGVTVNRGVTSMNGISTSTGEPSEITVRGFGPTFNETLFDNRKVSSGVSNRGFDFSGLNSDLVEQIEILKSPNSSLSAGAIGATINIIYPKPMDFPGLRMMASASTTYSPEEGKFTPNGNFLFSDTFANDRFGILIAGAYTETKNRSNEATIWGWEGAYLDPCQFEGGPACGTVLTPDKTRPVWFIQDYGIYQIHNWQMRENLRAVAQWWPANDILLTVNGNFSRSDLKEYQYNYAIWNNATEMRHVKTSRNGTITSFTRNNTPTDFDAQINEQVLQSYDFGFNMKWGVNDKLTVIADADMALSSLNPGGQFGDYSANIGYGPSTPAGINGNNTGMVVSADGGHILPYYTAIGPNGDASQFLNPDLMGSHVMVMMSQRNRNVVNQIKLQGDWEEENYKLSTGFHWVANHMKLANYQNFANNQWQAYAGYGPASNNIYTAGPAAGQPAGVRLPASLFTASFSTKNFIPGWKGSEALPSNILIFDPRAVIAYLESLGDPATPDAIPGFNWGCCDPPYRGKFDVILDPASFQHIYEDSYASYVSVTADTFLGDMPLRIHAGLRFEYTHLTSTGMGQLPVQLTVMPSDHTAFLVTYGDASEVANRDNYHYLLPNLDLNLQVSDNVQLRLDLSRTLTRPPLNYISPVLNLIASERVGSLVAFGGNPGLLPFASNNFDFSAEWYYAPNSYLSGDVFLKNVTDFIVQGTQTQTINNLIDPTTGKLAQFRVSSYVNGPTANIYGLELALQHIFGDTGFGFQANGTFVQSDRPYDPHNLSTSGFAVTGLAASANLVAFYDKDGFETRLAMNWRDSYLDHFGQFQSNSAFGAEPVFVNPSWAVDLSTRYDLTSQLSAYFEALNLLNATYSTRGRFPEQVLDEVAYGRRFTMGLHYRL